MKDTMYVVPAGVWLLVDNGTKVLVKFEPQPKSYGLGAGSYNVNFFISEEDLNEYIQENNLEYTEY